MNTNNFRKALLAKEKDLLEDIAQTGSAVLRASEPDVQDDTDMAVRSEAKDSLLSENSQSYDLLNLVRDALRRIDAGVFGKCLACGKPIAEKRLEAVPWAAFDLQHQEEADRTESRPSGGTTL